MNEFSFIEFYTNLQKDFNDSGSSVNQLEVFNWNHMNWSGDEPYYDEEEPFYEERLTETLKLIQLKIEFAYEFLGLEKMSLKLENELKTYQGKYGELSFIPHLDVFYSKVEWILKRHLSALTSHIKIGADSEYENTNSRILLERILRGTAKLLADRQIEPSNEKIVRGEVYKTLIHIFPDTVREIPIAKISKTYKPDIGLKRIKSAIEYKFVDSVDEAKTAIGGIFEDIQAYEGSEDWTTFYAVLYMTDHYLTQDQVEEEFKLSSVPHHWKPIVVYGKGKRTPK